MSDDDSSQSRQHLLNFARKHDAPPAPPPSTEPDFKRVRRFDGATPNSVWRAQAWSPDGSQLAFGGRNESGKAGVLQLWDGNSGHHEGHRMRHMTHGLADGQVASMSWSPDGKSLATAEVTYPDNRRSVHIRSQAENPRPIPFPPGLEVSDVVWSPDGTLLALVSPSARQTALVDPVSGAVRRVLDNLVGPVAWQPEGRLIAGIRATSVALVDPLTGEQVGRLAEQTHTPTALGWSRHGKHLAVSDGDDIVVYTADDGSWRWRLHWVTAEGDRGPDGTVGALQWLDGGGYLLEFRPRGGAWRDEQGSTVATVVLWDIETGKWLLSWRFFETVHQVRKPPAGIAVAPDGRRFAIADDNLPPVIWEVTGDLPRFVR